jgi:hypothetical protein
LPKAAQAYVGIIVALGLSVLMYALPQWKSDDPLRFAAFLILALAASAWKVRLPGLEGTISLNFVILLVAVVELNLSEAAVLCAGMGVMQSVWKAARKPQLHQVLFNACVLVLSGSLSGLVCRWLSGRPVAAPLMVVLPLAVLMSYLTNSLLVATVICLAQGKSLSSVWQHCNFWSSAYYMVGGAGAGLMIGTMRAAGWVPSMMVLPLMMLVYVSYRAHVSAATTPKLATA